MDRLLVTMVIPASTVVFSSGRLLFPIPDISSAGLVLNQPQAQV